jgi:flagellar basal body-associated protein FliL
MSRKGLSKTVIAVIIVAVLLISAVAVYFALSGGDETADTTENTELDTTDNTSTEPEDET